MLEAGVAKETSTNSYNSLLQGKLKRTSDKEL